MILDKFMIQKIGCISVRLVYCLRILKLQVLTIEVGMNFAATPGLQIGA